MSVQNQIKVWVSSRPSLPRSWKVNYDHLEWKCKHVSSLLSQIIWRLSKPSKNFTIAPSPTSSRIYSYYVYLPDSADETNKFRARLDQENTKCSERDGYHGWATEFDKQVEMVNQANPNVLHVGTITTPVSGGGGSITPIPTLVTRLKHDALTQKHDALTFKILMEDKKTVLLQSVVRPYREPRYMNKQGRFTDETLPKTPQAEDIPSSLNDQTEPKDGVATWTHSKSRIRGALHTSTIRRITKKRANIYEHGQYLKIKTLCFSTNCSQARGDDPQRPSERATSK